MIMTAILPEKRVSALLAERPQVPSRSSSLNQLPGTPLQDSIDPQGEANVAAQTPASFPAAYRPSGIIGAPSTSTEETLATLKSCQQLLGVNPIAQQPPAASTGAASCSVNMRNGVAKIKRWDGHSRTASDWDGLRRDPELWLEDGDCLVHLYARGQSRRGPSFRLPFKKLRDSNCGAMFSLCFARRTPGAPSSCNTPRAVSGTSTPLSIANTCEIYIPAPDDASRETSFQWHLTTRNFFAFVFGRPLVGIRLSQSLIDLQERLRLFRSGLIDNQRDFLGYADQQGYCDFVDCPDYALAMLHYAEQYQLNELWIDAFAHCVGMNDRLCLSKEFEPLSRVTKALITRSYLEMDLHLGRVMSALSHFLEDDLSSTYFGLSHGARAHLDRFRSFLHSFYVEKFGYWPPPEGANFSKALYKSLYFDFRNLYDYLVDKESIDSILSQKPASGGICVLQNVQAFNKRHKYLPLPHPMPLVPQEPDKLSRTTSQKTLIALKLGSKQAKTDKYMSARAALTSATNTNDILTTNCPLVKGYIRFERECARNPRGEKVSLADARKVRWILIYGVLQYLVSANRAPKEVRDTEEPSYPLCCLVAGTPPWEGGAKALRDPAHISVNLPNEIDNYLSSDSATTIVPDLANPELDLTMIHPDCEAGDYFTHTNVDPQASRPVSVEVPAPLRVSTSVTRNTSLRSITKSFSPFGSRRNSVVMRPAHQSFCEILVHGYGNGLNETVVNSAEAPFAPQANAPYKLSTILAATEPDNSTPPETEESRPCTPPVIEHTSRSDEIAPEVEQLLERERTPVLGSAQMEQLFGPTTSDSPNGSPSSTTSSVGLASMWSVRSSTSSSSSEDSTDSPISSVESSGLLGGLVAIEPPEKPSRKFSRSKRTSVVSRHGAFSFEFEDVGLMTRYPISSSSSSDAVDELEDSEIGVAISSGGEVAINPIPEPETLLYLPRKSFSAECLVPVKKASTKPTADMMDILSALQIPASLRSLASKERTSSGVEGIEDSAPAPIVKKPSAKALKTQRRLSFKRW